MPAKIRLSFLFCLVIILLSISASAVSYSIYQSSTAQYTTSDSSGNEVKDALITLTESYSGSIRLYLYGGTSCSGGGCDDAHFRFRRNGVQIGSPIDLGYGYGVYTTYQIFNNITWNTGDQISVYAYDSDDAPGYPVIYQFSLEFCYNGTSCGDKYNSTMTQIIFSNSTNWNYSISSIPIDSNFYINTWIKNYSSLGEYYLSIFYPNGTNKYTWLVDGNQTFPVQKQFQINHTDPSGNYTSKLFYFFTELINSTIQVTGEGSVNLGSNTVEFRPDVAETTSNSIKLYYNICTEGCYWVGDPNIYVLYQNWNNATNDWYTDDPYSVNNNTGVLVWNVAPGASGYINITPYIISYNMSKTRLRGMLVDDLVFTYYGDTISNDYIIYNVTNPNSTTPPAPTPNVTTPQPSPMPTPMITTTPNQDVENCVLNNTINYSCSYQNVSNIGDFSSASSAVGNLNQSIKSVDYSTHKTVANAMFPSIFSVIPSKVMALGTYALLLLVIGFVIKGRR